MPIYYHCWKCGHGKEEPIVEADSTKAPCCTCCHDGEGHHGPGMEEGDW